MQAEKLVKLNGKDSQSSIERNFLGQFRKNSFPRQISDGGLFYYCFGTADDQVKHNLIHANP